MTTRPTKTTHPAVEFGTKKSKLRLSVGKNNRLMLAGKATMTPTEFERFLKQAKWFLVQVIGSPEAGDRLDDEMTNYPEPSHESILNQS